MIVATEPTSLSHVLINANQIEQLLFPFGSRGSAGEEGQRIGEAPELAHAGREWATLHFEPTGDIDHIDQRDGANPLDAQSALCVHLPLLMWGELLALGAAARAVRHAFGSDRSIQLA
jgi:hypothetical protein